MIWKDGVPKLNGVDDWRDSAVLGGLLKLTEPSVNINFQSYLDAHGNVLRCPGDDPCDTSRDNTIPILAAADMHGCYLFTKAIDRILQTRLFQNGDICAPPQEAFLRYIRFAHSPTWFQNFCLWLDVFLMARKDKTVETNQFIAMYLRMPKKFLKSYCHWNTEWREPIRYYFNGWRNEPKFSEQIISTVEKFIGVSVDK